MAQSPENPRNSAGFVRVLSSLLSWTGNCTVRMQGEPAVRITIKGVLIFCSLIAGLIMAEVVAASNQNDSALPAAVGFNN